MLDIKEIKTRVDLAWLVSQDLGQPQKHNGRWAFWPCPFHADRQPSFGVTSDNGRFKCFGCGATGDHLDYLQKQRNLNMSEALHELKRLAGLPDAQQPPQGTAPTSTNDDPPSEKWQDRARAVTSWAAEQLWTPAGQPGLDYLHSGGLTDDTIRTWGLGWCPGTYADPGSRWGLDNDKVWLPRGVVIPCEISGVVWYLKTRRFDDQGQPETEHGRKYSGPRGGRGALFGADRLKSNGRCLLLCEGERDTLLAWQEMGDFVDVATLGGAGKRNLGRWALWLLPYKRILAAFDTDTAGRNDAEWWAGLSDRVVSVVVPEGNDLTDYHAAGGDLRAWLSATVADHPPSAKLAESKDWAKEAERRGLPCFGFPSWQAWLADVERDLTIMGGQS